MAESKAPNPGSRPLIKVLIVEDSAVIREFLKYILGSDPAIEVIGMARDGEEAVELAGLLRPDVITMDIHMPKMDGLEATRRIMESHPVPIVISSGSSTAKEVATMFHALEAGAVACVPRPSGVGHPEYERTAKDLVQTVKLMSEVKVVRRLPKGRYMPSAPSAQMPIAKAPAKQIEVVAIGGSTGAPIAFRDILSGLPKSFPVPILCVQHMSSGFVGGFTEWLAQASGFPIKVGAQDMPLSAGQAYVAPDGFHMKVGTDRRITLGQEPPEYGLRPSVSHLFLSVAHVFGERAVGVLLTGMGKDGAKELKLMKDKGSITIAQDEASSVVFGMPGEAVKLGAATHVMPPHTIGETLVLITRRS